MYNNESAISDKKIEKLSKKLAKSFAITQEDALSIIYEEWDSVERLFLDHGKVKAVLVHLMDELNYTYRIA